MAHDAVAGAPKRGKTHYGGLTIDTSDYGDSVNLEGIETVFKDTAPPSSYGIQTMRSPADVHAKLVRNVSGIALLPSRIAVYKSGFRGKRVDGYTTTEAARGDGIVDDHLPAAGVPNGDLFWLITQGPVLMLTDLAGGAGNVIADGDRLVALTAATSQATTAGRVLGFVVTTNATYGVSASLNTFGIAMSAKTTANTNATILVDCRFR